MSGKRTGGNLNHDNWDDEDAPEEAGVFQQADETELKTRVIKKAKRRGIANDDLANKPALFTGFQGFGMPVQNNPTFSFNNKAEEKSSLTESSTEKAPSSKKTDNPPASSGEPVENSKGKFLAALKTLNQSVLDWLNSHMDKNPYCYFNPVFDDYQKHLDRIKARYNYNDGIESDTHPTEDKKKNTSSGGDAAKETETGKPPATEHMQSTVSPASSTFASSATSPAPMFSFGSTKKAEPEAKKIGEEKPASSLFGLTSKTDGAASPFSSGTQSNSNVACKASDQPGSPIKPFSFVSKSSASGESSGTVAAKEGDKPAVSTAPMFSFGKKPSDGATAATGSIFGPSSSTSGTFSFGLAKSTSTSAPFSFGKAADSSASNGSATTSTFSFKSAVANAQAASNEPAAATGDEEEYVPPKAEVEKQITEDDALYTKRVKLFYNKDGKYVDKGIGNLFVKPLESGKNGLLIRADTNLGNILLNITLADSIPVQRNGRNNVTLVCVPNPPMEIVKGSQETPPPTMLLIRVKEAADADELCEKLSEYKNV